MATGGVKESIARVTRVNGSKWKAESYQDPLIEAFGRTRDEAVDKLLEATGGPG